MNDLGPHTTGDEIPVGVESYYDPHTRSHISFLIDEDGNQIGDANYDGTKEDAAASRKSLNAKIRKCVCGEFLSGHTIVGGFPLCDDGIHEFEAN